jgi:hypothetical protein
MKKIRIIGTGVIAIILFTFSWYLIDRFSYSKVKPFYAVKMANDTTLTIGIIGDSWVAGGRLDSLLHHGLLEKGFRNQILSSGHPGAKSKLIYKNLFKEGTNEHSSKFIIENRPDFCIVIAGVNDAAGQVGANFYSHHILLIINTLLHYNIKPIILKLPEFGIMEATNEMGFIKSKRNKIYATFTNSGEIDNIKTYRKALDKELESENLKDSIIQIDFDIVCGKYNQCLELYNGPIHLSKKGNEKLGQIITVELIRNINASKLKSLRCLQNPG